MQRGSGGAHIEVKIRAQHVAIEGEEVEFVWRANEAATIHREASCRARRLEHHLALTRQREEHVQWPHSHI